MFTHILVALDGSELAEKALPVAQNLAHASDGTIHLTSGITTASWRQPAGVTVITKHGRKLRTESNDRQMTEAELDAKFSYLVGLRAGRN